MMVVYMINQLIVMLIKLARQHIAHHYTFYHSFQYISRWTNTHFMHICKNIPNMCCHSVTREGQVRTNGLARVWTCVVTVWHVLCLVPVPVNGRATVWTGVVTVRHILNDKQVPNLVQTFNIRVHETASSESEQMGSPAKRPKLDIRGQTPQQPAANIK